MTSRKQGFLRTKGINKKGVTLSMASGRIKGTRHVRRRMRTWTKAAIGVVALGLIGLAITFGVKGLNKNGNNDGFSISKVVSSVQKRFAGPAAAGDIVEINAVATTGGDGKALGYVNGMGTLINKTGDGNKLTLRANSYGNNKFTGWKVDGKIIGGANDPELTICIDTANHGTETYDSATKIMYVTNTASIEAMFAAPLKSPASNGSFYVDIVPAPGWCWIKDWDANATGHFEVDLDKFTGTTVQANVQGAAGSYARLTAYDSKMKDISTSHGDRGDDIYVEFDAPTTAGEKITVIYHANRTDNDYYAVYEAKPDNAGSAGGSGIGGSTSPFSTQLQATANRGYKFKNWEVYRDGNVVTTLTEKNASYYVDGVYKFVANFESATYEVSTAGMVGGEPGEIPGVVTGNGSYAEGTDVTMSVVPNEGYVFDNWSYTTTDGINHTGATTEFTVGNIKEDIAITYTFKTNKKKVEVKPSPIAGGSVTIENKTNSKGKKSDYEEFAIGETAELIATPSAGYVFLEWKDSQGNSQGTSETLTINSVSADETYTAYFAKEALNIKTAVAPDGAGDFIFTYTDISGNNRSTESIGDHNNVKTKSNINLEARPSSGYHFVDFVDSKNNHYTTTPYEVTNVTQDETYTAVFAGETFSIKILSNPAVVGVVFEIDDNSTTEKNDLSYDTSATHKIEVNTTGTGYKFVRWEDQRGNKYTDNPLSVPSNMGDLTYTAILVKDTIDVTVDVFPAGSGSINFNDNGGVTSSKTYNGITSMNPATLVATAGSGYEFEKFVDEDGNPPATDTEASISISGDKMNKDKHFTAYFVEKTIEIKSKSSPMVGGSTTVNGKAGGDTVRIDSQVTLVAKPNIGYKFKQWEDSSKPGAQQSTNATWTITANDTATYIAVFEEETIKVKIGVKPSPGYGSVKLYGHDMVSTDTEYDVDSLSTITVAAYPSSGKKFKHWEVKEIDGETSVEYTDNPLTLIDLEKSTECIAIFEDNKFTINVKADPTDGGTVTADGSSSSKDYTYGSTAVLRATPASDATFLYWTDSAGTHYDGRRGLDGGSTLSIEHVYRDDTYTAHFVKKDLTVTLEVTPSGAGLVKMDGHPYSESKVQYHVRGDSSVTISAEPKDSSKYEFERWENKDDPTEVYTTNPLTIVSVTKPVHYVAVFSTTEIGIKVVASPARGGKVTKTINSDGSVTILASPNKGYKFANWKHGDKVLTLANKYVVKASDVKDGDVYTAYFKEDPNYDPKSDITREKFYREWRKVYDPNYTVTRESMKSQAASVVAGLRQYSDATPDLKNYAAFASARAYYEEVLGKDKVKHLDEIFGDSELITVEGEVLNPDLLPDFLVYDVIANDFTEVKFGDHYETEILTVKRIYEPEGFNNKKRTYLWRYTGAELKDNIYLLYNINDDKHDWATAIVEEDGVVKFTIDELKDDDIVAVVRVKIKE